MGIAVNTIGVELAHAHAQCFVLMAVVLNSASSMFSIDVSGVELVHAQCFGLMSVVLNSP
jgi:hypothetical protein